VHHAQWSENNALHVRFERLTAHFFDQQLKDRVTTAAFMNAAVSLRGARVRFHQPSEVPMNTSSDQSVTIASVVKLTRSAAFIVFPESLE